MKKKTKKNDSLNLNTINKNFQNLTSKFTITNLKKNQKQKNRKISTRELIHLNSCDS